MADNIFVKHSVVLFHWWDFLHALIHSGTWKKIIFFSGCTFEERELFWWILHRLYKIILLLLIKCILIKKSYSSILGIQNNGEEKSIILKLNEYLSCNCEPSLFYTFSEFKGASLSNTQKHLYYQKPEGEIFYFQGANLRIENKTGEFAHIDAYIFHLVGT